jgi:hypothetical protein
MEKIFLRFEVDKADNSFIIQFETNDENGNEIETEVYVAKSWKEVVRIADALVNDEEGEEVTSKPEGTTFPPLNTDNLPPETAKWLEEYRGVYAAGEDIPVDTEVDIQNFTEPIRERNEH